MESKHRSPRELVVKLKASAAETATPGGGEIAKILAKKSATMTPLFGVDPERLALEVAELGEATGTEGPELGAYYRVNAEDSALDGLAGELAAQAEVDAAYVKPATEVAELQVERAVAADAAPAVTPDFRYRQVYLAPAPAGISAAAAATRPGAYGRNVRIIDVEFGWHFSHEDLLQSSMGLVSTAPAAPHAHGTAVVGVIGGDRNGRGIVGIAPEAMLGGASIDAIGSAAAIRLAASKLRRGDIIIIELHRAGPRYNFTPRSDQAGYIPLEWWPDDYDAVRYATARGILVVSAAGNGGENLNDAIYDRRPSGFPASWSNPFKRGARDSGSILVGAGAPPPGTHGRNHGADRSRLPFSNYGRAVDAQGHGREVTTTGYGDLQGGADPNLYYTDVFSGTSSATPIVVGALACVQGARHAAGRPPLTPAAARQLLRVTGSPQRPEVGRPVSQRIGNRPNLKEMLSSAISVPDAPDAQKGAAEFEDEGETVVITWKRISKPTKMAGKEHRRLIELMEVADRIDRARADRGDRGDRSDRADRASADEALPRNADGELDLEWAIDAKS